MPFIPNVDKKSYIATVVTSKLTFWVDSFSQSINENSSLSLSVHNHSQSFSRKLLILSPNSLLPITTVIYAKDKVEKILEGFLDLIPSPLSSVKIQIVGGKITENVGFKSSLQKVKSCLSFFFPFSNSP